MSGNPLDLLPQWWWTNPDGAFPTTMTRDQLREVLLYSDGFISANGAIFDIKSRHLGVGVHHVWIERRS